MSKLLHRLRTKSLAQLFVIILIFNWVFLVVSSVITSYFSSDLLNHPVEQYSVGMMFVIAVIIAPLFETFVFQYGVFRLGLYFGQLSQRLIIASTILFSISHSYSWAYVFLSAISGFAYAYTYNLVKKRKNTFTAYIFVSSLHALSNLLSFILTLMSR